MRKFLICLAGGYVFIFVVFLILPRFENHAKKESLFQNDVPPVRILNNTTAAAPMDAGGGSGANQAPLPPSAIKKALEHQKPTATGPIETFYQSGKVSSQWILQETGEGTLKTYTPEGSLWMVLPFTKQRLDGVVRTYYQDGKIFSEENYSQGRRKGGRLWYYDNGSVWLRMEVRDDDSMELRELYSEDGRRADPLPIKGAPGQNTGYFKAYDDSGHEVMNWQQVAGEQGTIFKSYYRTGTVSSDWEFKNGKLNGRGFFYYPDGKVWIEMAFIEGKSAGRTVISAPDTAIMLEQNILVKPVAGEETRAYYPDGKVFWTLTAEEMRDADPLFHLKTCWQSDIRDENKKELFSLPSTQQTKPAAG